MKEVMIKALTVVIIALLMLNAVLMAMKKISLTVFWVVLAIIFVGTYPLRKRKKS